MPNVLPLGGEDSRPITEGIQCMQTEREQK